MPFLSIAKRDFCGDKFYVGNIQGDKGKSLVVELSGSEAGLWHDFATGEGGDIIDLWAGVHRKSTRIEFPEVMTSIRSVAWSFSKLQVVQLHIGIITMKTAKLLLEYIVMMMIVERDILPFDYQKIHL